MIEFMLAAAVAATPDAVQAELGQLQARAQAFVSTVTTQTQIGQVQAALVTNEGTVDQACRSVCSRTFQVDGGKAMPFGAVLFQYSYTQNINTYHYEHPFVPEEVLVEVDISNPTPGACFSQASWNAALVQAGWEPLKPYDQTQTIKVTDDKDAFARDDEDAARAVQVKTHGFVTKRGDRYLVLAPITASYWTTGLMLGSALAADEAQSDCLRTVITDRHITKKAYEAATKPA